MYGCTPPPPRDTVEPRSQLTGLFDYPFFFPDPVVVLSIHKM